MLSQVLRLKSPYVGHHSSEAIDAVEAESLIGRVKRFKEPSSIVRLRADSVRQGLGAHQCSK